MASAVVSSVERVAEMSVELVAEMSVELVGEMSVELAAEMSAAQIAVAVTLAELVAIEAPDGATA